MMGPKIIIPIILMALIASVSLFKVEQWEQAIVFKFREIDRSDYKPGLYFQDVCVKQYPDSIISSVHPASGYGRLFSQPGALYLHVRPLAGHLTDLSV